jgi:hypothetical protein
MLKEKGIPKYERTILDTFDILEPIVSLILKIEEFISFWK